MVTDARPEPQSPESDAGPDTEAAGFGPDTPVAEVIDADPDVVDRLVALNPVFQRLRVTEARSFFANMVTLGDAAAISGVPLSHVLAAANGRSGVCTPSPGPIEAEPRPDWMDTFERSAARSIDVRPILAAKREPFADVMTVAAAVPEGEGLVIEAPFNPVPLRRILEHKGFVSFAEGVAQDHWRIFCLRKGPGNGAAPAAGDTCGAKVWAADDGVHIDVRGLEAPAPMVAILSLLDQPDHGGRIIVHHWREPAFLFPELAERGWSWCRIPGETGEVRLFLSKDDGR